VAWQDSAQTADDEFAARIYTAYSRAVVALAAHGLFGGLVGIGLTKRHVLGQVTVVSPVQCEDEWCGGRWGVGGGGGWGRDDGMAWCRDTDNGKEMGMKLGNETAPALLAYCASVGSGAWDLRLSAGAA
jgi:hypothetical protein